MKADEVNQIIEEINKKAETEGSFVSAEFGDKWREWAMNTKVHTKGSLVDIAWKQGRMAILLEDLLRKHLIK